MKRQTKKALVLSVVAALLVCVVALSLVACNGSLQERIKDLQDKVTGLEQTSTEKTVNILIGDKPYEITTRMGNLFDVLGEMKSKGTISVFDYTGSGLDAYIKAVDTLVGSDADRTFIAIYHDIDNYSLKGTDYQTGEIATTVANGKTYFFSNVGCAILPLVDGASYYLAVQTY